MIRFSVLGFMLLAAMIFARGADATNSGTSDPVQFQAEYTIENALTPYQTALLCYKTGKYDEARTAIDAAEKAKPGDVPTEILKSRILTELGDFAGGEQVLRPLLTPEGPVEVQLALGDLLLRKHSFNRAAKYYTLALQAKPDDPDIILKLVYAKIGADDRVAAGQYASQLTPLDAKDPYDAHASYYFAKAAMARATSNTQEEDDAIQTARTVYGITVTNRYLKTYLEIFASPDKTTNPDITPAPLVQPAPSGVKQ
jgi:tetratricopeptide (TPR) repeat protein